MYEKTLSAVSGCHCSGSSERRTEKRDLKNIIYLPSAAIFPNGKISKKIVLPVEKRLDGKIAFERFDGAAVRAGLLFGNERKVVFDGKIILCGGFVLRVGKRILPLSPHYIRTVYFVCRFLTFFENIPRRLCLKKRSPYSLLVLRMQMLVQKRSPSHS